MSASPKLATIFGGSGFVGRYIARRLAKEGWRVRVAVRRPNEALFVKPYGVVGQVEPILANIRDDASTAAAIEGADAVINCVGTFDSFGKNNFDAVQVEGAERIARLTRAAGARLVHLSAIGADANSDSNYGRTKGEGEAAILGHMPRAVILRPSVIFGTEDEFFNRFASMATKLPFVPVVGADVKFQPVFVDDVARAAAEAAMGKVKAGTYELGGPDAESFADLMRRMLRVIRRNKFILPIPLFAGMIQAGILDLISACTFRVVKNSIITKDQVMMLRSDNVVSKGAKTFKNIGFEPTAMDAVLDDYLYPYRPYGQYSDLTESAKS